MFFLAYVVTFLGQLNFTRNYFFKVNAFAQRLLVQNNQFDTTVTFPEQLLFWNSYFFRRLTSSQQLLFQNSYLFKAKVVLTTSISSSSLGQLVFRNTYFRKINLFRISISIKEFLLRNRHFYKTSDYVDLVLYPYPLPIPNSLFGIFLGGFCVHDITRLIRTVTAVKFRYKFLIATNTSNSNLL